MPGLEEKQAMAKQAEGALPRIQDSLECVVDQTYAVVFDQNEHDPLNLDPVSYSTPLFTVTLVLLGNASVYKTVQYHIPEIDIIAKA
ncbi:hypothetical protein PEBR_38569 [Penicillium brasilianum]|uniref:Uncharacterized protein n=1 Tax=Penicillium brasilianum TaxID=104259 RepID=A0A1S9RC56_PENBI|nr:hypothetical protein PEBR_38569 [Penicillium brasilianum]